MILGFDQQGKSMPKWPLPNGYEVLKVSDKKYELRKLVTGRNDSPQPVTYANANAYSETETKTDANAKKLPVSRGIEQFPRDAEDVRLFMAASASSTVLANCVRLKVATKEEAFTLIITLASSCVP